MMLDTQGKAPAPPVPAGTVTARPGQKLLLAFVRDAQTEAALRDGLVDLPASALDIRRGTAREAIAALLQAETPRVVLIDVAGEEQPLAVLEDLAQVLEPNVQVLVIGDRENMDFYRRVTRVLGASEYLFKPITGEFVARHFLPVIGGRAMRDSGTHGGRIITVTGARGGAGSSTVAVNLAWYLGHQQNRHTMLLDTDVHSGTVGLKLGMKPTPALREALYNPNRIDELYVERAAQQAGARLSVLIGEETLEDAKPWDPMAAGQLLTMLQRRYNFVIIDLPYQPLPQFHDLLNLAHQRILVADPSLPSMRDALRLLALPAGPSQARRPTLVLNRAGRPGGLSLKQVGEALKIQPDIVIADLTEPVGTAELLGEPAAARCKPLQDAIARLAVEAAGLRLAAPAEAGWLRRALRFGR